MLHKINTLRRNYWEYQESFALELFHFQRQSCQIYNQFLELIHFKGSPKTLLDIPLLPIECFKHHEIKAYPFDPEIQFMSSGTSDSIRSRHLVDHGAFYHKVCVQHFSHAIGVPSEYCHLALLPSYLEQGLSSLVSMVQYFVTMSKYPQSNFYLYDHDSLFSRLLHCRDEGIPTILWGVSYALLDFLEKFELDFPSLIILETGGMKGRKKEIIRPELHERFRSRTNAVISSEYGMTELFSQAYLAMNGHFAKPKGMWTLGKEINDPLSNERYGKTARIGVIDTANIHSCAFILTQDLGRVYPDNHFEIVGRMDNSDLRGCNLLLHGAL